MSRLLTENSAAVLRYLQDNPAANLTADDLAEALEFTARQINGIATGLQKKGFVERVEVDGIEKKVIRCTALGENVDPDMEKPETESDEDVA